jgi:hypothetical protein
MAQCASRGVPAMHADVFTPLPGEGTWSHVLLADGNLGIGGDPVALLRRAAQLIAPAGTVLVELDPAEPGLWRGQARVRSRHAVTPPFPWASAGPSALPRLAARAGLQPSAFYRGVRQFVELAVTPGAPLGVAPMPGGGAGTSASGRPAPEGYHAGRPERHHSPHPTAR